MKKKLFVELSSARLPEQARVMEEIKKDGVCPFCSENLKKFHKKPILREGKYWLLTPNQWPYENTKIHLLIISKKHLEKIGEVSRSSWAEMGELISWSEKKFKMKSGAVGIRFGDPKKNSASVRHLHVQLLNAKISDKTNFKYKPLCFHIA